MDKQWMEQTGNALQGALQDAFGLDASTLPAIVARGQNSLTAGMKAFVLKNGSKDIEAILLQERGFEGSALQAAIVGQLGRDLSQVPGMETRNSAEIAGFAASYLVNRITEAFQAAPVSKDLDGICAFIGIDKNLLSMVNSPMGKLFGKFF